MKLNVQTILLLFFLTTPPLLKAQNGSPFEILKAKADKSFVEGNYTQAKVLYDSCKMIPAHEFDDNILEQLEIVTKCIGYKNAIDEISKDPNGLKACMDLYKKILELNPKDMSINEGTAKIYRNQADGQYEAWMFDKAKESYQKLLESNEADTLLKARMDSCDYFIERLKNGFLPSEVSVAAEYKNGLVGINSVIQSNMAYPETAVDKNISGRVWVGFVVNDKGKVISNLTKVIRGIGGGCDEEAVRIVRMMNEWKPATINGRAVPFQSTIPIQFTLKKDKE